jgi:crotonobetainyl-CoA:carnitine CoA-transferase CaiB-like acyl-CoA transferase
VGKSPFMLRNPSRDFQSHTKMQSQIFQGLKIVELASVLAGPAVGMFFAELGAEVIKVENKTTGGDTTRHWKMPSEDPASAESAYFYSVNWGKRHVFLDLTQTTDREQLMHWLNEADVVISNFKSGGAEKLGLHFAELKKSNPRLIYASISAYGEDDLRPGFDVAIQAETGWMHMNGEPGSPPVKMPVALMDLLAAHQLKEGILVALLQRERTGKGSEVTVSLFDAGVASLANQATNWLNLAHLPQRIGSRHPNIAPYGEIFLSQDGKMLIVSAGTEQQFRALCFLVDAPQIAEDERFATNALRLQHRDALASQLQAAFRCFPVEVILERCHAASVPVAPIRNLQEVFDLPATQDLILEEKTEAGGVSKRVRTAVFKLK